MHLELQQSSIQFQHAMQNLNEMFKDISIISQEQQCLIDSVSTNIRRASGSVTSARRQIVRTDRQLSRSSMRRFKLTAFSIVLSVLLLTLLVIVCNARISGKGRPEMRPSAMSETFHGNIALAI